MAGAETDGYDANGNQKSVLYNGSVYGFTFDDEDRLTSVAMPSGITDTFTYNGLGLRVGKVDSTGTYLYVCDGTSPGSPVLIDGHTLYTPGLSENHSGVSSYYDFDRLGNLWTVDGTSKNQLEYEDFTGFGAELCGAGSSTAYAFGGGNGCQTDADTGLVLMGHRYYDSRQGRFISQDPAGSGDNWYAYAGNNPTNEIDPEGLDADPANQQAGPVDGDGQAIPATGIDDNGNRYWDEPDGGRMTVLGQPYSIAPGGSSYTEPGTSSGGLLGAGGLFEGVGGAFGVGFSAVGSAATFHLWNGGAARHDPSFGVSRGLADVGVMAGTSALGAIGAVGRAAQETLTVSRWGRSGLEAGDWVMKGKATRLNYILSFKWQPGLGNKFSSFNLGEEFEVPASSIKWPSGAGIDGWWKGLFGQRIYTP